MANYGLQIDLLKLKGAFMRNLQGKAATKKCIIIPVDDNDSIFLGEKGCYLNMTAIELENPQYSDTHCIKGNIPKEVREQMSKEEQYAQPILGGLRTLQPQAPQQMQVQGTIDNMDDLPF